MCVCVSVCACVYVCRIFLVRPKGKTRFLQGKGSGHLLGYQWHKDQTKLCQTRRRPVSGLLTTTYIWAVEKITSIRCFLLPRWRDPIIFLEQLDIKKNLFKKSSVKVSLQPELKRIGEWLRNASRNDCDWIRRQECFAEDPVCAVCFQTCHLVLVSVWQQGFIRGLVRAAKKPCTLCNLPLFSKIYLEAKAYSAGCQIWVS